MILEIIQTACVSTTNITNNIYVTCTAIIFEIIFMHSLLIYIRNNIYVTRLLHVVIIYKYNKYSNPLSSSSIVC